MAIANQTRLGGGEMVGIEAPEKRMARGRYLDRSGRTCWIDHPRRSAASAFHEGVPFIWFMATMSRRSSAVFKVILPSMGRQNR